MATTHDKELAYQAGQAVMTEPTDRRTVEACPFAPGTEERTEWLRGFADALEAQATLDDVRQALQEAENAS